MVDEVSSAVLRELQKRGETGDKTAQYKLGMMYLRGEGTHRNDENAFKWLRMAALNGHKDATHHLAMIYLRDLRGFQSDEEYKLFKALAENGDAEAQYYFATYCVSLADDDNYLDQIIYWYEKAAAQNFIKAQYHLGRLYIMDSGVPLDYLKAFIAFKKAAENNHRLAQFELAELYYNGCGVAQDAEKAIFWYKKSAAQNITAAKRGLGRAYLQGKQSHHTMDQAIKWYKEAANDGDIEARNILVELSR